MDAKTVVRYAVYHGLPSVVIRRAARRGDLQALLISDPDVLRDPFLTYDAVRARGPLVQGRLSLVTATHQVCHDVLRSDALRAGTDLDAFPGWMSRLGAWAIDERVLGPIDPPSLLVVEPPDHTRYRRLVSKVFTARAIAMLRPRVEELAHELLDEIGANGPVDLVAAYGELLPVTMIAEILGVPPEERASVLRWGRGGAPSLDVGLGLRTFRSVDRSVRQFNVWLGQHLARLREQPGDDLLSRLVALDGDDALTDVELRATAGLLLAAGFETTVNLLGSGTELLVRHPEQRDLLLQQPELWPGAVEEMLRYESPVQVTARMATRDTSVAGTGIRQGQMVVTMLGGANRDPAVFDDPHRFDVTRENAREHLAFSGGIHYCLGAALARLEGEVGLRVLFERFPDLALADGARRRRTRVLRGWERLPIVPGPARARAAVAAV